MSRIRTRKPRTLEAARADILSTMDYVGQRFGVCEWSGSVKVCGAYAVRAARALVASGEARLVRDDRDGVRIKAVKQPYPITELGRKYGASHD